MAAKIYLMILWLIASHNLAVVTSILEEHITPIPWAEDEVSMLLLNMEPTYQTTLSHTSEDCNMHTNF
jgi:hypothetical protein